MKILLIAGHGQGDPGACALGYQEATLTREVVASLANKLKPYAEVEVFDTSKNMYKFLKLLTFNFKKYDYVLEVHFNAAANDKNGNGKTTGTEVLVHTSEKAVTVEQLIVNNISELGFTNRGVKLRSNLQNMNVCKGKQGVSYALVEVCFIDDLDDMKLYQAKKEEVVTAIADGILKGHGIQKQEKEIKEHKGLTSVNDIVWELSNRGILSDKALWLKKLEDDSNDYCLAKNFVEYLIEKGI
ncbi:MAG: N-acetylmuramoyl-L-alanine amidase [Clostridia bacterium]|nr:N-acetylmuramoyl-L-alanine amidase [Clostridia bacterium]MBO5408894.1 N-acetylmuramoyl-L-alanine amidase [Clostridia bacterium]